MSKMNSDDESSDSSNVEDNEIEDVVWSSEEEEDNSWDDEDDSEDDVSDGDIDTPMPIDVPWTSAGIPRPSFPFTGNSGVQIPLSKDNILGIFESFFTEELIQLIVSETNRYARQFLDKNKENRKPKSRTNLWYDTNENEIRTFLALLLIQGVDSKPDSKLYFTRRESIESPFFSRIISEKRFFLIQKFLHFCNNEEFATSHTTKKLYKIAPIINYLRDKFMTIYIPEKNIAIDESLIGWKGNLSWKQYIPSKRRRFGIKMFALCESATGYVYNFFLYTGATTIYGDSNYPNEPISSRIVLELIHPLLNQGYCLYTDNYYTNIDLLDKLAQKRTDCVGTMRKNRVNIPVELKAKKLKKGDHIALYRRKQMVLKWYDKREVIFASSLHDDSKTIVTARGGGLVEKPKVVLDYNANMGGVDLADSNLHYYSSARNRLKKYYMKIFRHFLDMTTLNCYKIYCKLGGKKHRINFILDLAEAMIEKYAEKQNSSSSRRSKTPRPSRLIERHFPSFIPPTKKAKPTKRCHVCHKKGIRKESRYWCANCHTGLCPAPCFEIYHTKA